MTAREAPEPIQLPPLSSPNDGPPQRTRRARRRTGDLQHAPLRWRIPRAGHARRRLPTRAYPRGCWKVMIANGQSSTDLTGAGEPRKVTGLPGSTTGPPAHARKHAPGPGVDPKVTHSGVEPGRQCSAHSPIEMKTGQTRQVGMNRPGPRYCNGPGRLRGSTRPERTRTQGTGRLGSHLE